MSKRSKKRKTTEDLERRVAKAVELRFGRSRAIPAWKLGEQIGLGTGDHAVSRIRSVIRTLRREGKVIVAAVTTDDVGNQPGYFFARTAAEYQQYMGPFRHRAIDILATLKAMDAAAEKLWGAQARLDQMGSGQAAMDLGEPDDDRAKVGGPLWWEVDAERGR